MGEKKIMKLELDSKKVKIKELLNGSFLELECWVISDANPNNNMSHFTLESMQESLPMFKNRPVLGAFNETIGPNGDFMGHEDNGLKYDDNLEDFYYDYTQNKGNIVEIPLGVVRSEDPVEIVEDKKTGLHWIKLRCALWTAYNYKAIKSLLMSRKGKAKVSVEVEVLDYIMEGDIQKILKFEPLGFTILGSKANGTPIHEGIEGAHLTVLDFIENELFAKKAKALHYAYSALENYNSNSNKNNVETSSEEANANSVQNSNINITENFEKASNSNDDTLNEAPQEEITMQNEESQRGGNNEMLTMNEKRDLLDNYLRVNRAGEHEYIWVCDLTETEVFYNLCTEDGEDIYFRATYSVFEDEEGHPAVSVDIANEVRVVKKWADFAEDVCPDCGENPCVCEKHENESEKEPDDSDDEDDSDDSDDNKEEDFKCEDEKCEESKCEESKCEESKCEDEKCEKCEESKREDEKCEESKCEEEKCEDAKCDNEAKFAEENAPVDLGDEPDAPAGDGLTPVEGVKAATESIAAPEVQTEAENTGDATAEVELPAEAPATEEHVAEPVGTEESSVSVGPNCQAAEVVPSKEEEAPVEQPNDNDKEKLFSATVNVNGEDLDVNALYEKFSSIIVEYEELNKKFDSMRSDYESLQNEVKVDTAKKLAEFGANFVNEEDAIDDEIKAQFTKQIEEKCMSYEFNSKDEVTKFAKTSIAMYLYEQRSNKKNNNSVVMPLNVTPDIQANNSSNEAFDSAFEKLQKI